MTNPDLDYLKARFFIMTNPDLDYLMEVELFAEWVKGKSVDIPGSFEYKEIAKEFFDANNMSWNDPLPDDIFEEILQTWHFVYNEHRFVQWDRSYRVFLDENSLLKIEKRE